MRRQARNPYKRYFFQAALEELETENVTIFKAMEQWVKFLIDYIGDMADLVGTSNVNVHTDKRHKIKTLFRGRRRMMEDRRDEGRFIPGVGKVRILPMEYED